MLEFDPLFFNWNEVFAFDCRFFAWNLVHVADGVDYAAYCAIASIFTFKPNYAHIILAAEINLSLLESDASWLVLILNQDCALGIVAFQTLHRELIQKLHLELLIGFPLWVIHDSNLNVAFLFVMAHCEQLILLLVIFWCLCCAVDCTHPESEVLRDLLLDRDGDIAIRLSNLITQVLKADRLTSFFGLFLLQLSLPLGAFLNSNEIFLLSGNVLAIHDTLNSIVRR